MPIKDMFCEDVCDVFLNLDEFAEWHDIGPRAGMARRVRCVIDKNETSDIASVVVARFSEGVAEGSIRVYLRQGDIPRPAIGEILRIDGSLHIVQRTSLEMGMLVIELSENEHGS